MLPNDVYKLLLQVQLHISVTSFPPLHTTHCNNHKTLNKQREHEDMEGGEVVHRFCSVWDLTIQARTNGS